MDGSIGRLLGRTEAAWREVDGLHTATEIAQQPAVWREMASAFGENAPELRKWIAPYVNNPAAQIIFTGAGTSSYIGETVAAHVRGQVACHVQAIATTDLVVSPASQARARPTLLVSFARSGNSPESVEAINLARMLTPGVRFLNIHCNAEGALAVKNAGLHDTKAFQMPAAACDRGFAMTSSYTSMLLAALAIFDNAPAVQTVERLARLASGARQLISPPWSDVAQVIAGMNFSRLVFLGSGPLAAPAREAALKVLELTAGKMVAVSETSMGLRHGPKALIDDNTLVCCLVSSDPQTRRYDQDIVNELRLGPRQCHVLEIDVKGDVVEPDVNRVALPITEEDPAWIAPVAMVMLQQIALELSVQLGLTPDNPFPDGSVNRVVQGVTIHPLSYRSEESVAASSWS